MEFEYLKIANSPLLWISVIPAVALVMYQAGIFTKKAVSDGTKMGVTKDQFLAAAKASFFASLGPSLVIVIGMVGLLASVGGPVAWMRLAYIGSVMYELPAADRAATAAGSTLGTADMTSAAFANAVWVMSIGCLGWIIMSVLFTDKMGNLRDKIAGNSRAALGVIAAAGGMGAFGYQTWSRAIPAFSAQTWTAIAGFGIMVLMNLLYNKTKKPWLKQFGMTIAMVGGMIIGAFTL